MVGTSDANPANNSPDLFLHAGNEFREGQERDLKAALSGTDPSIPLVFVSGNHDLGNTPTPKTIEDYCKAWGDDYFSFWVRNLYMSMLTFNFSHIFLH